MDNIARFELNEERCIGCGLCTKVCLGQWLSVNEEGKCEMQLVDCFGWDGCWKCMHCVDVCPQGAISILGRSPEEGVTPPAPKEAAPMLDALIQTRHSCRRYLDRNVDRAVIDEMLQVLMNLPNGGNKLQVEYSLIADKEKMRIFCETATNCMEDLAAQGIYPTTFDKKSYEQMKEWRRLVRPEMMFCGAPHLLVPHTPGKVGCWEQDPNIAATYFELLCASRGLGAVQMSFPVDAFHKSPELLDLLEIPRDHFIPVVVGFGYPEIRYTRGIPRLTMEETMAKVNEPAICR